MENLMSQNEYQQAMQDCAMGAIQYAEEHFDIGLGWELSYVHQVEAILAQLHKTIVEDTEGPIDPETVVTLSNLFGAWLGELFRSKMGGLWAINDDDPSAPVTVLLYGDRQIAFSSRVFYRIMGGAEYNVATYFDMLFNDCVAQMPDGFMVDTRDKRLKAARARIVTE